MPTPDRPPPAPPPPLDTLLTPGRAAFNRADFFAAHELWESVWHSLSGDDRLLVQGLIQIAAGLHHLQRGRTHAAAGVLARGVSKLATQTAPATSLPIAALARDVARLLETLAAPGIDRAPDAGAIHF